MDEMDELKDCKIHFALWEALNLVKVAGIDDGDINRKIEMLLYIWLDGYASNIKSDINSIERYLQWYEKAGKYIRPKEKEE